ncbi:TPA: hypothetical protein ACKP97_001190 [Pseudomonas aeruginosa]|uniref:hypothetical protein n=1 Tax=Pseudomonas aeruginosa TaxID=287 RepID=UPI000AD60D47|nr:hypothetical protein [Pseudomonas aeruginosa]MCT5063266.1 hypothetical protein [Pseudomonas aeruginosa]MCZ9744591.1 hypothetical protein [Pseudomonas aeruginosa]MDN4681387.1 hypothetical protein [Pseudomonas aeruginosa]MDP5641023.1 hypothetical protein [Pseudomonas aeruginosa]WHW00312.1 hypothetical protein M2J01_17960 [Pseudomonas aeruginosa]
MSYSAPRICHHQRVTQWLAAIRQHAAWLYAADEQYLYLVAEANELYQCGIVGLQDRHDMVTDALGMYGWAIEHGITRETHYCADCCYDVIDGDPSIWRVRGVADRYVHRLAFLGLGRQDCRSAPEVVRRRRESAFRAVECPYPVFAGTAYLPVELQRPLPRQPNHQHRPAP